MYRLCGVNECFSAYDIGFEADSTRSNSFTLSGDSNGGRVVSMVGSGSSGAPNSCRNDWLLIGCARVADKYPQSEVCEDRLCGGTFNADANVMEDKAVMSMLFVCWLLPPTEGVTSI